MLPKKTLAVKMSKYRIIANPMKVLLQLLLQQLHRGE
jgi:hypothetical protein